MSRSARGAAVALAALLLGGATPPEPAPPDPALDPPLPTLRAPGGPPELTWKPEWGTFSAGEWATTGVAVGLVLGANLAEPRSAHRRGGLPGDEAVRDVLRASTADRSLLARDISDVTLTLAVSYPYVVDALAVAGWNRRSPKVAAQMTLINLEVMLVTLGVQSLTNVLVSRERPYGRRCGTTLDEDSGDCSGSGRYRSFFSGHTSLAFSAAAVTCAHHKHLKLHGKQWADRLPCALGFLVAGTTGTLRIVGDRHYLSDVLVGASVGTLIGYGLPWLLHYRHGDDDGAAPRAVSFTLTPARAGTGLGLAGSW